MTTLRRQPAPQHLGDRMSQHAGPLRRLWHNHGLSCALITLFLLSMVGQIWSGWYAYNADRRDHSEPAVGLGEYLRSGHFGEATFENFESEFLQMAFYVLLTVWLFQRGSSESKRPDVVEAVDLDPRNSPKKDEAPWPVRRGGLVLVLYENSLSVVFVLLFIASFILHATTGAALYNEEQLAHSGDPLSVVDFMMTAQFWFESFQNWQSEFLSLAAMVVLTIFLRQRGSPESKPVDAPLWETGN
jgi:hypothetical protein